MVVFKVLKIYLHLLDLIFKMKSRDAYLIKKGSYNYENSGSIGSNGAVTVRQIW